MALCVQDEHVEGQIFIKRADKRCDFMPETLLIKYTQAEPEGGMLFVFIGSHQMRDDMTDID